MATLNAQIMNQLTATNGKVITCKAAVAWKAKEPLDITDIQVIMILDKFLICMALECTSFSQKMSYGYLRTVFLMVVIDDSS